MSIINQKLPDAIDLRNVINQLFITHLRHPLKDADFRAWHKQFADGAEKLLSLLIIRFFIYRTNEQLLSSLRKGFKEAALYHMPTSCIPEKTSWKDIISGKSGGLKYSIGPPRNMHTPPGKSGEVICNLIKKRLLPDADFWHPDTITHLSENERYLLVDDGTYTGQQFLNFLNYSEIPNIQTSKQFAIVVGLAHEAAITNLKEKYPNIPVFFGEKITSNICFESMCKKWVHDGLWTYSGIDPYDLYLKIVGSANFDDHQPLGFGSLGCMVAFEHSIPDDSLQLLWDESKSWTPLLKR